MRFREGHLIEKLLGVKTIRALRSRSGGPEMITVKLSLQDLVKNGACLSGRQYFEEIAEQGELQIEWTPLCMLWLATQAPGYYTWLLESRLVPTLSLSDLNLSELDLSGAMLDGVSLTSAILDGANLSDANLSESVLRYASLRGADLRSVILDGANLRHTKLIGARMCRAPTSTAPTCSAPT